MEGRQAPPSVPPGPSNAPVVDPINPPPTAPPSPPPSAASGPSAGAPEMVQFSYERRRPGLLVPLIFLGLVIAIVALGVVGYTTLQDVSRARDEFYTASVALSEANASVASTEAALASATAAAAEAKSQAIDLTRRVNDLDAALSHQTECTTQLATQTAELARITDLQRQNVNRYADNSTWATANAARDKALNNALSDFFKAYQAAFKGQKASANSWISAANKEVSVANSKLAVIQGEIKAGNAQTKTISDALTALSTSVAATKATCSTAP